jgi:hypothetical protein
MQRLSKKTLEKRRREAEAAKQHTHAMRLAVVELPKRPPDPRSFSDRVQRADAELEQRAWEEGLTEEQHRLYLAAGNRTIVENVTTRGRQ